MRGFDLVINRHFATDGRLALDTLCAAPCLILDFKKVFLPVVALRDGGEIKVGAGFRQAVVFTEEGVGGQ